MLLTSVWENSALFNLSFIFPNETSFLPMCAFKELQSIWDLIELFQHQECYRHTYEFSVFLCIANLLILVIGLLGNVMVIVGTYRLKKLTASSIFILNLAAADMLVILCCIPATLVANLIIPWVLGEFMCKVTTYSQGASVFSSVYSLVAISFDRFRAIHQTLGITPNITLEQSYKIICVIWALGSIVTLPWAFVFEIVHVNPFKDETLYPTLFPEPTLPFCREVWDNKFQEMVYFLLIHVFACFLLPLGLITVCNVIIWKNVLSTSVQSQSQSCGFPQPNPTCHQKIQQQRKFRVLKIFTGLTFAFFICWLPLYVIQGRVKFFYTEAYKGSAFEQWLVPILIPAAQLLGSCNSCVNPVLYALLNQKFRQSFKLIFSCSFFAPRSVPVAPAPVNENNSIVVVVAAKLGVDTTQV